MLVLKRHTGQNITIAGMIQVRVLAIKGERVVLGIEAPPDVSIVRSELLERAWPDDASEMSPPRAPFSHF